MPIVIMLVIALCVMFGYGLARIFPEAPRVTAHGSCDACRWSFMAAGHGPRLQDEIAAAHASHRTQCARDAERRAGIALGAEFLRVVQGEQAAGRRTMNIHSGRFGVVTIDEAVTRLETLERS